MKIQFNREKTPHQTIFWSSCNNGHYLRQFTQFSHMRNVTKMTALQVPVKIRIVQQESTQHPSYDTENYQ